MQMATASAQADAAAEETPAEEAPAAEEAADAPMPDAEKAAEAPGRGRFCPGHLRLDGEEGVFQATHPFSCFSGAFSAYL